MKKPWLILVFLINSFRFVFGDTISEQDIGQKDTSVFNKYVYQCFENNTLAPDSSVFYGLEAGKIAFKLKYVEGIREIYSRILTNASKNKDFFNSKEYELFLLLYLNTNEGKKDLKTLIVYDSLAYYYNRRNKPDDAIRCFNFIGKQKTFSDNLTPVILKKSVFIGIGISYLKKGRELSLNGFPKKAIEFYQKSLVIFNILGDKQKIADCHNNIGVVYINISDNINALTSMLKALKINEEKGNKQKQAYCLLNIGVIYDNIKENSIALDYFYKSLKICLELDDKVGISSCYINIGSILNEKGDYKKSIEFYNKAYVIFDSINDITGKNRCLLNIGNGYDNLNNKSLALEYFMKSLELASKNNDKNMLAFSYLNLAEVFQDNNNLEMSISYAHKGLHYANFINEGNLKYKLYKALKDSYYLKKDYKKALEYTNLYLTIGDSLFNAEKSTKILKLQTKYETDKKEKEIEIQAIKITAQQTQLKKNKIIQLLQIVVSIFIIIIIIQFVIRLRNKQRIQINEKNREIESEKIKNELIVLKSQINPHFLFNTLNGIYGQAIIKSENTGDSISKLASIMRYIFTEAASDRVKLDKEIQYIANYIELQRLRLTDKTKIILSIPEKIPDYYICPLLLIAFIENAFKYGVSTEINTEIIVNIEISNHFLEMKVKNDKNKSRIANVESTKTGINNTIKRLDLLYGSNYNLDITENEESFIVKLKINLQ